MLQAFARLMFFCASACDPTAGLGWSSAAASASCASGASLTRRPSHVAAVGVARDGRRVRLAPEAQEADAAAELHPRPAVGSHALAQKNMSRANACNVLHAFVA